MSYDDANYHSDARNCERDSAPTLDMEQDDGSVITIALPTVWAVCPVCNGKGSHVNPSIDCNGISAEEFADDPDFAEEYFSGAYDQTCNRCGGRTTVREIDYDRLPADQIAALQEQHEAERAMDSERLAEIRFGC